MIWFSQLKAADSSREASERKREFNQFSVDLNLNRSSRDCERRLNRGDWIVREKRCENYWRETSTHKAKARMTEEMASKENRRRRRRISVCYTISRTFKQIEDKIVSILPRHFTASQVEHVRSAAWVSQSVHQLFPLGHRLPLWNLFFWAVRALSLACSCSFVEIVKFIIIKGFPAPSFITSLHSSSSTILVCLSTNFFLLL